MRTTAPGQLQKKPDRFALDLHLPGERMLPTSIVRRTMDVTGFGGIWPMRICIYKTDEAPELTLLLREGLPIPGDTKVRVKRSGRTSKLSRGGKSEQIS